MLKNIKLGINDLCKDKYFVLFYILFLSSALFIVSLSMFSFISTSEYDHKIERFKNFKINEYDVIPLVMDEIDSEKLLANLSEIYKEDAFGYLYFSKDAEADYTVYLILGDVQSVYSELESTSEVTIFASEEVESKIENITINQIQYHQIERIPKEFEFFFNFNQSSLERVHEEIVWVVVKNPVLSDWFSLNNYSSIIRLMTNTKIKTISTLQENNFLNIDSEKLYVKPIYATQNSEINYLKTQLYPFLGVLSLCFIALFIIAAKHKFEKKLSEYAIYVLCGATDLDVSIRMVTYLGVILFSPILISLGILSRIARLDGATILAYFGLGLILTSAYFIYLYRYLKRKNLMESITKGK